MPPDIFRVAVVLLAFSPAAVEAVRPRRSCRHHFLANVHTTSVLPLQGEAGVYNVVCHMPSTPEAASEIVTEVHSGLSRPHQVTESRSVNFQILDLNLLRDMVRWSNCEQTLTVKWETPSPESRAHFIVRSLLNESLDVVYVEGNAKAEYALSGPMAGIRHILPVDWDQDTLATVVASPLSCRQKVLPEDGCLFRTRVMVNLDLNPTWIWEFAFRTHRSDQALFSLQTANGDVVRTMLERDFFLRVDTGKPIPLCQLSDGFWHTVAILSEDGDVSLIVDNFEKIPLTELQAHESRLSAVEIELDGEILLIDPTDVAENCELNDKRRVTGQSQFVPACSGCQCTILNGVFDNFPAPSCGHNGDEAYRLLRDSDRLSFFYIPVSADSQHLKPIVRLGLTYKSESDIGLLLFGFWQEEETKGRFQVHYRDRQLIGIYCENQGEEVCKGCSISRIEGFGNDQWTRVAFFESYGGVSLVADKSVCVLSELGSQNNLSLAEVYSIPVLATGSAVFVGGTFYEKKKSGLYLPSFEHKYFENTREKVPSLRGCLKDVFVDGKSVDLSTIHSQQMEHTLVNAGDDSAYAIQVGCVDCSPSCPAGVRCRPTEPRELTFECDCSDIEQFWLGECRSTERLRPNPLVPLSTFHLDTSAAVLPLMPTKAALSKVWMKLSLPKSVERETVIAQFNSHRETLFYVFVDADGIGVHVHPSTQDHFETIVREEISYPDDRVHLISLERRTPLGTRPTSRKSDLFIDGVHNEIPDVAKYVLSNVTVRASEDSENFVVIHDMGLAYEFDEHHPFLHHSTNRLHQVDLLSMLLRHRTRGLPEPVATADPFLWKKVTSPSQRPSPHGQIVAYTPDAHEPQQLLSASWVIYSLVLTTVLCLLLTICLLIYCCILRRQRRRGSESSDRDRILRDSPDYSVKLRSNKTESESSYDGDGSIGTDDTDLNAYRDIPSHRVKIYRESMVSILVPGMDQPSEAIVKRVPSTERVASTPLLPPSPAPLVRVDDQ
ncbi:hypothetical protein Aduo_002174 [Ancylostoma duodenale]